MNTLIGTDFISSDSAGAKKRTTNGIDYQSVRYNGELYHCFDAEGFFSDEIIS